MKEYIVSHEYIDGIYTDEGSTFGLDMQKELIRCKDCKFSMSGIDKNSERYILCQLHERSYGVTDDGFCAWAERKEE